MQPFSMSMSEHGASDYKLNCTMKYTYLGKTYTARVRVSACSYVYGVTSTESHSRLYRAFYPHRRALGEFQVTVDAIGYQEYRRFMNWLRCYAEALLTAAMGNQKGSILMEVQIPARHFHRYGILTQGVDDHDHIGSMVFSKALSFMTIKDFNDAGTAITTTNEVSQFHTPKVDADQTVVFYPVTSAKYKDAQLYDAPPPDPIGVINPVNDPNGPGSGIHGPVAN